MSAIVRFAKSRPVLFGAGYSLMKTTGCDLMVQKVVEKRENIDWKRTIAFGSFGLFYLGGVQYFIYVPLFSRIFPNAAAFAGKTIPQKLGDAKGIRDLFAQVALDQFVHHPLMYFPVFYMIKDFVTSDAPNPVRAITEYTDNIREDLSALWKVWIPSTFLNFAFMPMWARIPWVASTSLIWTCILSTMRGGSDVPAQNVFVAVDRTTMELVTRTVVGPPPKLDPSRAHVLIVCRGLDQPGIISALTQRLYEHECMVTTSKMLSLGHEFAIMMHASVPPERLDAFTSAISSGGLGSSAGSAGSAAKTRLHKTQTLGGSTLVSDPDAQQYISVRVITPPPAEQDVAPTFTAKLWLTGVDKPGLLFRLSQVVAEQGLNIEHLQTEQHVQGSGGSSQQVFSAHCHVCTGASGAQPDVAKLRARLKELEAQLGVSCSLEEVRQR